jgi:transcriptional regulator with XRE-family HTH domain
MEQQLKNPIEAARESTGRDRRELAMIAGTSYLSVWQAETGRAVKPSPKVLAALEKFGFNARELDKAYTAWRAQQAALFMGGGLAAGQ